jgi:ATP-dependent Clp protease protease subunit
VFAGSESAHGRETRDGPHPSATVNAGKPREATLNLSMTAAAAAANNFDDQLAARLLYHRVVLLGTEVDEVSANRVCSQLLLLSAEDPNEDISLYIHSPGGVVYSGMAIYDTMRLIPNDVATLAMGFAASMGQFLLCAGTKGKRYSLPHTRIMMHQGSAGIGGTAADIAIQAENLEHSKRQMERLLAENTGQSVESIREDSDRDRWFSAQEALSYGMIDRVVESLDGIGHGVGHRGHRANVRAGI